MLRIILLSLFCMFNTNYYIWWSSCSSYWGVFGCNRIYFIRNDSRRYIFFVRRTALDYYGKYWSRTCIRINCLPNVRVSFIIFFRILNHLTYVRKFKWDFLSFRLWIGVWVALYLFLMVAFDLSALVRFITRFTEESFAALIALIFIVEAFKKLKMIIDYYPVDK